jgi:hypothetical protein
MNITSEQEGLLDLKAGEMAREIFGKITSKIQLQNAMNHLEDTKRFIKILKGGLEPIPNDEYVRAVQAELLIIFQTNPSVKDLPEGL